jgi:hypothetical protein
MPQKRLRILAENHHRNEDARSAECSDIRPKDLGVSHQRGGKEICQQIQCSPHQQTTVSGDIPPGADLVCTSLQGALDRLQTPPLSHHIQQVFILGGRRLYEEAMRHEMCDRLYVTVLDGVFPADIYHPHIDHTLFTSITCDDVPQGQFTENGITYRFTVYQRL